MFRSSSAAGVAVINRYQLPFLLIYINIFFGYFPKSRAGKKHFFFSASHFAILLNFLHIAVHNAYFHSRFFYFFNQDMSYIHILNIYYGMNLEKLWEIMGVYLEKKRPVMGRSRNYFFFRLPFLLDLPYHLEEFLL